jgi:hypothetical protein
LRHEEYAALRENGRINELCPLHSGSLDKILEWVGENLELFSDSKYFHLGADETWSLGSCPKCREAALKNPELGSLGAFSEHLKKVCEYVISHKRRPLVWADMFAKKAGGKKALALLPDELIPVIWRYYGDKVPRWDNKNGREQWGASAIQCSWNNYAFELLNNPFNRIENVLAWNRSGNRVIHTVWGRPDNLRCLYPPWAGSVGVFIAAGNPSAWSVHPWRLFFEKLNIAFRRGFPAEAVELAQVAAELPAIDEAELAGREYLSLALRHWAMSQRLRQRLFGSCSLDAAQAYIGERDRNAHHCKFEMLAAELEHDLKYWVSELDDFWTKNCLSDKEEFIAEKIACFDIKINKN